MKKDDGISILLSIVINVVIILLIPSLATEKIENKKIKVGLVAYENKNRTKIEGKRNTNSSEKKVSQELIKEKKPSKKETLKEEKPLEKKKTESNTEAKKTNKIDLDALNSIATNISTPKVEVLTNVYSGSKIKEIDKVKTPKKEFGKNSGIASEKKLNEDIELSKESVSSEREEFDLKVEEKIAFNSEIGKDESFDRIFQISGETEGLPSGYKLGTEDGDIVARWDNSNREPVYPESAQLKGLHGSVRIRMYIDEAGNIRSLHLEKGSGVPEINNAIEEVGRTWKIYLSKNGLSVKGNVILEYNFILKGKTN